MSLIGVIFSALVVLQAGIIVTGGAVRLTGSGLGCPTWPQCTKGSFTPVAHQAQGKLHSWIEFGNRLLTFLLVAAAIAAFVAAVRFSKNHPARRRIIWLAIWQIFGIFGQGILGGITVLTHLNPLPVSGHFLLSIPLIAGALSLRALMLDRPTVELSPTTMALSRVILALTVFVITLGTIVTGSGPHAGDIHARRYGIDPRTISWIHADSVIALISLAIGLYFVVRVADTDEAKALFGRRLNIFLLIALSQGAIGYIQYFTHLPELIVGMHLLGATLVWVSMWNLALSGNIAKKVSQP
ncbi:MAG: COX15/CtaA family protein [Actinomycetes bacterium]